VERGKDYKEDGGRGECVHACGNKVHYIPFNDTLTNWIETSQT